MKKKWLKFLESQIGLRFNCRRTSLLIEKKTEVSLSFKEFLEMRLHLLVCPVCRQYKKQSKTMQKELASLFKNHIAIFVPMKNQKKQELEKLIQEFLDKKKST